MTERLTRANCLSEAECLLIDPRAGSNDLFEQAQKRLDTVRDLMEYAAGMNATGIESDGGHTAAGLASAAHLLLADAGDLLFAARRMTAAGDKGGRHGRA